MRVNPYLCIATAGTFVLASMALAGGPPNNNCEDRIPIFDGATAFSTVGATTDGPALPPACDEGFGLSLVNDIWFNYTATCDGVITVSTCNAATYDTRLAAYTGPCSNLVLVACNDDGPGCATFTSIMEWFGDEGVVYRIRVGGFGGSGTGTLTVSCGAASGSDCCFANGTPGCDDAACATSVCSVDPICCSDGWDASCAALALVFCEALCTGGGGTCPPSDHDCFTTGGPGCTDIECCEAVCAADPFCCDVAWDGICVGGAVAICGGSGGECPPSDHDCFTTGGPGCTDEKCCVAVCALDPFCCDVAWDAICVSGATATCNLDPVANDDCADAIEIFLGDIAFSTLGATTDGPALPAECDKGFGLGFVNDVWFVFTGTENDILSVSTCSQASFDTRLAAYTGNCGNLTLVACNDDGPGCTGFTSLMQVLTSVGEDYLIRVGGFGGSGTGTLSLFYGDEPGLENDNCEDAIAIGDGVTAFTTVGATTDGPALPAECNKGFGLSFVNDVWFSYTASCDGLITASTCDSASFDTRLAAYTGSCSDLTLVACNDDGPGCGGFTSVMEWEGTCGVEYLIRVGGFAVSGTGQLNVSCDGDCNGGPACAEDFTGDGVVDGADLGQLLNAWGACPGCPEDLTGDGVVDGADLGQLLNAWGDCE